MLAVLFPGQGSQSVGMLKELSNKYPLVLERFQEASDIIGKDLWDITQNNSDDYLNRTQYTQPILLTACFSSYEVLQKEIDIKPKYFAGHSLGEYTALTAAGAISFAEAVELVYQRGKIMQDAVPRGVGAMAAILGLEDEEVIKICTCIEGGDVFPANFNAPGQVVIGGKTEAVNRAIAMAKEQGARRAVLLPVSVPSHTPLLRAAAAKFSLFLDKIHWETPRTPVIFNVDGKKHKERYGIEAALGAQLYEPVQWSISVGRLADDGIDKAIEVGPGKVLTGLVKRIDKRIACINFTDPEHLSAVREFLGEL